MSTDTIAMAASPLHGPRLVAARTAWFTIFGLVLAMYVGGFPARITYLTTIALPPDDYQLRLNPATAAALVQLGIPARFYFGWLLIVELILALSRLTIAGLIFWRKSNYVAAILTSVLIICLGCSESSFTGTLSHISEPWRLARNILQASGIALTVIVFYVFPDGRFVPYWTRWLAVIYAGIVLLWLLFPRLPFNPIPGGSFDQTPIASVLFLFGWQSTGLFALVYRYRRVANPTQRQQMKWAVCGLAVAFSAALTRYGFEAAITEWHLVQDSQTQVIYDLTYRQIYWLTLAVVPVFFAIAILRYHLWDIDHLINRTLVYSALTGSVILLNILVVGSLSTLLQTQSNLILSLIATGFVAVLFQPLRLRLQRSVNRLMYGDRDDPYMVLVHLGQRLEASLAPNAMLQTIAESVARALRIPYVAIALAMNNVERTTHKRARSLDDPHTIVAAHGSPTEIALRLPLNHQGEPIGQMLVAVRAPGESLTAADRQLLDTIAPQASMAAYAVRLTTELQYSRERLRTALEEERRRLRRDLHDGLGPALASQAFTIDTACQLLEHDPAAAIALLRELKRQSRIASADVRRLVYDLRPPVLDDLGLIAALQEQFTQYERAGLRIVFQAPDRLPHLSAASEVAAYRIVLEAVTNVARHAHARTCVVSFAFSGALNITIRDDSHGLPEKYRSGVGIASMRERAAELGGTCTIASGDTGGTLVAVSLPLAKEET